MTQKLLTSAVFAGLAAGLIAALLQFWLIAPLILEGERYESGEVVHFAGVSISENAAAESTASEDADHDHASHDHGDAGATGLTRNLMTFFMNLVTFTGFGLVLVAGFALAERAGRQVTAASGVIWGLAGFAAVQLAPAVGLPPELPGVPAADVYYRQIWWACTIIATATSMALLAFGRGPVLVVTAAALLLLPHIVGAPHLDGYFGDSPPELAGLFVARVLGVGAISWAVLGALAGQLWSRES